MAHWKKSFPSKYLQAAELDDPIICKIKRVTEESIGGGEDAEMKLVVYFAGDAKGLVLNVTRAEAIATIAGDEDTDKWVGVRVQLSRGTTRYQGKKVSCIVVDAPPLSREAAPPADAKVESDIPF